MITIISRKYGKSSECKLSVRIKTPNINTAIALGISVNNKRWEVINETLKAAQKAYKRKSTIFFEDTLAENLWEIVKRCQIRETTNGISVDFANNIIRQVLFKDALSDSKQSSVNAQKPTLFEALEDYINRIKSGKIKKAKTSESLSYSRLYSYVAVYKSLVSFSQKNNMVLDWDDMTFDWLLEYKQFLLDNDKSLNTISGYISTIKTFLRYAKLQKYTTTTDFDSNLFSSSRVEVDAIALTEEQISTIHHLEIKAGMSLDYLSKDKNIKKDELKRIKKYWLNEDHCNILNETKNLFVLACLTGQRFSDFSRMNEEMVVMLEGKPFLHIIQKKTKKEVFIPCNPLALELLKKNTNRNKIFNNNFNDRIKIVCLLAGLTGKYKSETYSIGVSDNSNKRICDLVSTHTARRSFATNAYRRGIPLSSIMAITGHSSELMLRKYLKINTQERALLAAKDFESKPMSFLSSSK